MNPKGILLLSFLALAQAHDVISRCREVGFHAFADQLELHTELVNRINKRGDTAIWAVPDEEVWTTFGNNTKIRKRQSASTFSAQSTFKKPPPNEKRNLIDATYGETLYTYLEDPAFVNLGKGQPGRLVSKYAGSSSSLEEATFQISSGLGKVTSQTCGPFLFDKGVIFGVTGFFTLPSAFSTSIQKDGRADNFYAAVVNAKLQDFFDSTPACTVFAPVDSKYQKRVLDVKKHIICGFLGHSPDLYPGTTYKSLAGTPIKVTYGNDGHKRVNGLAFVKTDIITKNGVLHLIEKWTEIAIKSQKTSLM
ncbi:hypothetical protein BDD12DRAFT_948680 [Trichophaea hybrida]|nr:hypothetical protein BDD12DRAFT_948680 [Trichophaea hybrida]